MPEPLTGDEPARIRVDYVNTGGPGLLDLRWALAPIVGAGAAIVCLAPVLRRLHA